VKCKNFWCKSYSENINTGCSIYVTGYMEACKLRKSFNRMDKALFDESKSKEVFGWWICNEFLKEKELLTGTW